MYSVCGDINMIQARYNALSLYKSTIGADADTDRAICISSKLMFIIQAAGLSSRYNVFSYVFTTGRHTYLCWLKVCI